MGRVDGGPKWRRSRHGSGWEGETLKDHRLGPQINWHYVEFRRPRSSSSIRGSPRLNAVVFGLIGQRGPGRTHELAGWAGHWFGHKQIDPGGDPDVQLSAPR